MTSEAGFNVGTAVLFENERLRVWEMVLDPGERSELHKHVHDHVLIYDDPSSMRGWIEGEDEPLEFNVDTGFTMYTEVGAEGLTPHYLENVGNNRSRHVIVEILGSSRSEETRSPETNERFLEQ